MKNLIRLLLLFITASLYSAPFFGGYYASLNTIDNNKFMTTNFASFYVQSRLNNNVLFYMRMSGGVKYYAGIYTPEDEYNQIVADEYTRDNQKLSHFTFIPNFDLLYVEFKTNRNKGNKESTSDTVLTKEENEYGEKNFDLFHLRLGRIHVHQYKGLLLSLKGDGFDSRITLKNFGFRIFGITNSFDYLPFFDFISGSSQPVFTNWDNKRYPVLMNINKSYEVQNTTETHTAFGGFVSDANSADYNFFFDDVNEYDEDYDDGQRKRLNTKRYAAVLAGRIFTGFTFDIKEIHFQNFAFCFLANVDLIPEEFVIAYPSRLNAVHNTFGGKYNSFYLSFNANGKIVKNLYYDFEGVYETGINVTYYDTGHRIKLKNALINSFAFNTGLTYFFDVTAKPTLSFRFMYAHGDDDVQFKDNTVLNKSGQDNNFRSPTSPKIGLGLVTYFSNIMIISLENTIKPFSFMKKETFSRLVINSKILLLLRPNVRGNTFFSQKPEYILNGEKNKNPEKAYLGIEVDTGFVWQIFSDLSVELKGGVLIPNYLVYANQDALWTVGFSFILSY